MNAFFRCRAAALIGLSVFTGGAVEAAGPTIADCLSANETSISLKHQYKLRAARSELLVCAAASCPTDVRNECTRRAEEVNKAIPTIVFEAKDAAGNDLAGVTVTMDGQVLAERLEGAALSIDPGTHSFVFETAGQPRMQKTFVVSEGEKGRRERILFGAAAPKEARAATTPHSVRVSSGPAPAEAGPAASSGSAQRILGWTIAGAGLVGLGLGAIFEIDRSNTLSKEDAVCPSGVDCPRGTQTQLDSLTGEARTASHRGTASFIAGGSLVAGGLVLVLTAHRSGSPAIVAVAPVLDPHFQGAMVSHVW